MKTQFEHLRRGLNDVEAFLSGETEGFKVHVPEKVDVRSIRTKLKMTQARFSQTFGFSLDAVKHWEGGRRTPEAPARTLLTVIDRNPAAVLTALQPAAFAAAVESSKPRTVQHRVAKKARSSGRPPIKRRSGARTQPAQRSRKAANRGKAVSQ